ncbi:hypothetical protein E2C01_042045 [Portunus trituberculatus]|uniref:Uncharacterized protein n=1 Tax=Portunus trituberculatus TaxID=210409 RepID=A0A5B7FSB7_PORTR|nr:hypothetical protein [Portunus trituberculatus]
MKRSKIVLASHHKQDKVYLCPCSETTRLGMLIDIQYTGILVIPILELDNDIGREQEDRYLFTIMCAAV